LNASNTKKASPPCPTTHRNSLTTMITGGVLASYYQHAGLH
jgi:hypothetical protein